MLFQYADRSLRAYASLRDPALMPSSFIEGDPLHGDHGPAFVMLVTLLRQAVQRVDVSITSVNINHFSYFVVFQLGIISLYFIACRWMSQRAALGVALLFSTQPVLWGHAFINPKDSVFMSLFLASTATGLWMVDRTKNEVTASPDVPEIPLIPEINLRDQAKVKRRLFFFALGWVIFVSIFWIGGQSLVQAILTKAYQDGSGSLLGQLFQQIAAQKNSLPLALYIKKGITLLDWFNRLLALVSLALLIWFIRLLAPNFTHASLKWCTASLRKIISAFFCADIWLVSFVLGFSTAVRVVAPLAGLLVAIYALIQRKWNGIPRLICYAFLSLLLMLALWPHLWPAPVERFTASLFSSTRYPVDVQTLFGGKLYNSNEIPPSYLPVLLGLQLTEPTLLLIFLGIFIFFIKKIRWDYAAFVLIWFALPFTLLVVKRVPLYDNFRHILFILPPLFLLAGTGLDWLLSKFRAPYFYYLITGAAILPALLANISLHPYQYIYYNQLAGGLRGAYRQYQLDYWDVSYREAALYLNKAAPANARIVPLGPYHLLRSYARPDLQFIDPVTVTAWQDYDYLVISTRNNQDLEFDQFQTVYTVQREGVPLTVVKKPVLIKSVGEP